MYIGIMKRIEKKKFNICIYDVNRSQFISYDILPMVRFELDHLYKKCIKYLKTKRFWKAVLNNKQDDEYWLFPRNQTELKSKLDREFKYRMWGKCEWEIILTDWPCGKVNEKVDGYEQVKMNLDIVTDILYEEYKGRIEKYLAKYEDIVKTIKGTT